MSKLADQLLNKSRLSRSTQARGKHKSTLPLFKSLICTLAAVSTIDIGVKAQTCFPISDNLLPRTWAADFPNYENSGILVMTGDETAIYTGGTLTCWQCTQLVDDNIPQAVVERTDLASHIRTWTVAYGKVGGYVTGIALGPTVDGVQQLAAYVQDRNTAGITSIDTGDDGQTGSQAILVLSSETGQVLRDTIKLKSTKFFATNRSSGMIFASKNEIFLTQMIGEGQTDLYDLDDGANYASKLLIAKLDPTATSMTALKTQSHGFGRSSVIRYYPDSNSNHIFIGGNSNSNKRRSSDPDDWRMTISMVNKDSMTLSAAYMPVDANIQSYTNAPYIDHMHFDASNSKWFGTTRGPTSSSAWAGFRVWKMDASLDAKPLVSASMYTEFGITSETGPKLCLGLYPKMIGSNSVHLLLGSLSEVWYFTTDFTSVSLVKIFLKAPKVNEYMQAFFPGTVDLHTSSYPTRKLAYLVSWQEKDSQVSNLDGHKELEKFDFGALISTSQAHMCNTLDTTVTDETSLFTARTLQFKELTSETLTDSTEQSVTDPSFGWPSQAPFKGNRFLDHKGCVKHSLPSNYRIKKHELPYDKDETICLTAGSKRKIPFVAAQLQSHTCSDNPLFVYYHKVRGKGKAGQNTEVSMQLNSFTHTIDISVNPNADGSQEELEFQTEANLPDQINTDLYTMPKISVIPAATYTIEASTVATQYYVTGEAQSSYSVPDFSLSPAMPTKCVDPLVYTSSVVDSNGLDHSWITQMASGKGMQWMTSDTSLTGTYKIRTTATLEEDLGVVTESIEWDLLVSRVDCFSEVLTIDPNGSIFTSNPFATVHTRPSKPKTSFTWTSAQIYSRKFPWGYCGPKWSDITQKSNTGAYTESVDDIASFKWVREDWHFLLELFSDSKIGTVDFQFRFHLRNYQTVEAFQQFYVEYIDFCNQVDLYQTVTSQKRQLTYTVGDPAIILSQSDLNAMFTVTEKSNSAAVTDCLFTHHVASPALLSSPPFTFTGSEFKIDSNNLIDAETAGIPGEKDYQFLLQRKNPAGSIISNADFQLDVKMVDPCVGSILSHSVTSSILLGSADSTFTYLINEDDTLQETFNIAALQSSVNTVSCPAIEIVDVVNADGSPIDVSVFTLSKGAKTFTVSTIDGSKAQLFSFELKVRHQGYSQISSIPFSGSLIQTDPCAIVALTHPGIDDQIYNIGDAALIFQVPAFEAVPALCETNMALEVKPSSPYIDFDQNTGRVSIQSQDVLFAGGSSPPFQKDYVMTVKGTSGSASLSLDFNIRVFNSCVDPSKSSISSANALIKQEYVINVDQEPVEISLAEIFSSYLSFCGDVAMLVDVSRFDEPISFQANAKSLTIATDLIELDDTTQVVTIVPYLQTYPLLTGAKIEVEVNFVTTGSLDEFTVPLNQAPDFAEPVVLEFVVELPKLDESIDDKDDPQKQQDVVDEDQKSDDDTASLDQQEDQDNLKSGTVDSNDESSDGSDSSLDEVSGLKEEKKEKFLTEIEIGSLVDQDEETEDKIVSVVFKNGGVNFIRSIGSGTELKLAIDTEDAIPGNYTVAFVITEEINGVTEESKKEFKIQIFGDEDDDDNSEKDKDEKSATADNSTSTENGSESTFESGLGQKEANSEGQAAEIQLPTMKLVSISKAGVVRLEFDKPMIQEYQLSNLNQTHFDLSIVPYDQSMMVYLQFTWQTTRFEETYVELSLDFQDPLQVSQSLENDQLKIVVVNNSKFMTQNTFVNLANDTKVYGSLSKQANKDSVAGSLAAGADSMGSSIQALIGTNFLLNLFTAGSLNTLWGMIHSFEIVAHYYLFGILFPPNAAIMYDILYNIANFSFVPTDIIFGPFYSFVGDNNLSLESADEVAESTSLLDDYIHLNSVKNNLVIFLAVMGIVEMLLQMFSARVCCRGNARINRIYQSTKDSMVWSFFLRLWIENYIDMALTNTLRVLYFLPFDNWYKAMTSTIAIIFFALGVIAFPILVLAWLCLNRTNINSPTFQLRWGTLAVQIKEDSLLAVMYLPIFLLRRIVMVLLIIFGEDYQSFQIHLILIETTVIVIYISSVRPYNNAFSNIMENINELLIMANTFFLVLFSNFIVEEHRDPNVDYMVTNVEFKYEMGSYNLMGLACIFAFNICVILFFTIKDFIIASKAKFIKYCLKKTKPEPAESDQKIESQTVVRDLSESSDAPDEPVPKQQSLIKLIGPTFKKGKKKVSKTKAKKKKTMRQPPMTQINEEVNELEEIPSEEHKHLKADDVFKQLDDLFVKPTYQQNNDPSQITYPNSQNIPLKLSSKRRHNTLPQVSLAELMGGRKEQAEDQKRPEDIDNLLLSQPTDRDGNQDIYQPPSRQEMLQLDGKSSLQDILYTMNNPPARVPFADFFNSSEDGNSPEPTTRFPSRLASQESPMLPHQRSNFAANPQQHFIKDENRAMQAPLAQSQAQRSLQKQNNFKIRTLESDLLPKGKKRFSFLDGTADILFEHLDNLPHSRTLPLQKQQVKLTDEQRFEQILQEMEEQKQNQQQSNFKDDSDFFQ